MSGIWSGWSGIDNPDIEMDVLRDLGGGEGLPGWAQDAVVAVGEYGIPAALVAVVLLAWYAVRRRADAAVAVAGVLWAGLAALVAYLVNMPIRDFVARPRPEGHTDLAELNALIDESGYSFVSDHASTAMAVAVALFLVHRWLGAVACALALLQGFARVLMGVHYPTDVIGGYALGMATALLLAPLAQAGLTPLVRGAARAPGLGWLAPAGAADAPAGAGAGAGAAKPEPDLAA
ncbi:phosphatase PAP2 family protein [Streptomyces sp. 6N223]|uniref:phosphatase PAP2 family protein n=1 Tax=Streptomyces sp. 6N223 TaxID=3457412 RepID=UPI003FD34F54